VRVFVPMAFSGGSVGAIYRQVLAYHRLGDVVSVFVALFAHPRAVRGDVEAGGAGEAAKKGFSARSIAGSSRVATSTWAAVRT